MRIPSETDLKDLRGRDASWFAVWLRVGLLEYIFERKGRRSFPGAEPFVDQREGNIATDLKIVADALSTRDQEAFRAGVGKGLETLDFSDDREAVAATYLVELAAGVKSRDVLRVLSQKTYLMSPNHESVRLYDLALDVAVQLPDLQADEAIACLRHLVRQEQLFQVENASRVLIAMARTKPVDFVNHYEFLKPILDNIYGYAIGDPDDEAKRVERRRQLIKGLSRVVSDWSLLVYPCKPAGGARPEAQNWWLNALARDFPEILAHTPLEPSGGRSDRIHAGGPGPIFFRGVANSPTEELDLAVSMLGNTEPIGPSDAISKPDSVLMDA